MKKFRVGIIGCGQIAGGYNKACKDGMSLTHACSYQQNKDTDLVSICDPDKIARNKFAKKWNVDNTYSDIKEMLLEERLDIISICSPTEFHLEAFLNISKAPSIKGIFCEKPLSYDYKEAIKIASLVTDIKVSLNYFRRWNPTLNKLRENLNNNHYGLVNHVTVNYTKGLLTNGSHLIDLLNWFFSAPIEVKKYDTYGDSENDPGVDFKLKFSQGFDAVFLHIPKVKYTFIELDIHTEIGKISIHQRGQEISFSEIINEPFYNTFDILKQSSNEMTEWQDSPSKAIKELIDVINNGGQLSCSINEGLIVSQICKKILDN